jgi:uncharacterized membrane protein YoaK (UPF0700 family)
VATTGNLLRFTEACYTGFVDKDSTARAAFRTYASLTVAFVAGALSGAFATYAWGIHAIWIPGAFLAFTLGQFIIDEREGKVP